MKLPRRQFLHLASGAAALLPAMSRVARAQAYPSRPVHLIAPFPAGGAADLISRLIGQPLSERLGQPVIIENRSGAGGNVGTEMVVRAPPDGYTLLCFLSSNSWSAALYDNLNFDPVGDIEPVASIDRGVGVLVVHPSFPAKTVPEFIAYAKSNPGKVSMASGGVGSPQHLYGELFKEKAGVDMLHVPYRGGGPALTDLLAGHVQVMFDTLISSMGHIRAGELRALAVTSATRSEALPELPSIGEFVPGYEATGWQGIGAPSKTPVDVLDTLHRAVNDCLADPKVRARIDDLGYTTFASSRAEFGQFVTEYTEKWAKLIRAANIKAE
jgi:tripartite-type tricarboxylate transporter receptor subunit TctC